MQSYYVVVGKLLDRGWHNTTIIQHLLRKQQAGKIDIPEDTFSKIESMLLQMQGLSEKERLESIKSINAQTYPFFATRSKDDLKLRRYLKEQRYQELNALNDTGIKRLLTFFKGIVTEDVLIQMEILDKETKEWREAPFQAFLDTNTIRNVKQTKSFSEAVGELNLDSLFPKESDIEPEELLTPDGKNIHCFKIESFILKEEKPLLDLIMKSGSMKNSERQYWFNLLVTMTPEKRGSLRNTLMKERLVLEHIEQRYSMEPIR